MSVKAEPIYWPEELEESTDRNSERTIRRVTQFRHRVGEYEITRLILESTAQEPTKT